MMPTTREFLGDSLIKELEGAGFSPQSINAFAKNEYRQRKAAQEEEQRRLLYRADDMKLDGKTKEALLSGEINEQEAKNAQKFEEFGAKKHGFALGAAKTVTGIANTVERVGDFINPFYEGKRDKDGNYIYQNGLEKSLRPKIKNVEKMRDDYEKATGETSWGSRLAEIGTELVGDPINFVGGVGLLSKGSKLAQFGKKTLYFAGTGAASGGVAALGEGKNDEETLKNIGAGAVGGALLGHAIDQGIQGISKLIAKRQASKMANEADAIESAENSEFLGGERAEINTAEITARKDEPLLHAERSQRDYATKSLPAQIMTAKEFATKEIGLDEYTAKKVVKEAMPGKEKSDWTDADTYADIVKFKNFEIQRDYAKAYGKKIQAAQASINNAREQSAIRYADTQKAINEYAKQGMSASATRELINAKFKPSADEINYTRAYNGGVDVDARLTGQGIFYALEKDIAAQAYTPEIYATRLKQRGFSDESVQAFTQAYATKDIDIAKEYVNKKVADAYESRVQREVADEINSENRININKDGAYSGHPMLRPDEPSIEQGDLKGNLIDKEAIWGGDALSDLSSPRTAKRGSEADATIISQKGNLINETTKQEDLSSLRAKIERENNIVPIKEFGTNYAEFYHDGKGAIDKLLTERDGQVAGAFYRKELGDIDLVWGNEQIGLNKILAKHKADFDDFGGVANGLKKIIDDGKLISENGINTIWLKKGDEYFLTGLSKGFLGNGENNWIVTSYKKTKGKNPDEVKGDVANLSAYSDEFKGELASSHPPLTNKNIISQKGNLINEEAKNSALPNGVSGIGDNASGAGGRQGGDEEILRQSGRNTADASEEKWTAKSDRQMEQRSAFKTDGDTDATASSKQMVEKQGRDYEKVGDRFSHFTIDDVINKKLNFINRNNLGKKGWLDDLNLVIKKYGLKDKETKNKFMSVMISDKFKYNREFHHSELKDVMPRISPLSPKYPEISNNAYKELNEIIKNKTIPATKEQNLRFFEEDANGVSEDALHLHTDTKPAMATGAKEINAKTINANSHIASGLVGGTLNSIDEDGNFNPDRFAAGFLAGLAGSKAVAIAARKMTPQLYNKILGAAKKMPQMAKDNPKLLGKLYANGKDVSLNSFAGEKAITANVGKLDQAKAMLENGADEVEIWQKTGWFKDKDGAWKFEIGDSKARLNPNFKSSGRLGELLEHEELFKAYPELKDISVKKIRDDIPKEASLSTKDAVQKEKLGIYNVTYNDKSATLVRRDLEKIDDALMFEKGSSKKGGAIHIKKHLEPEAQGAITQSELLNIGKNIREYLQKFKEPFIDEHGGRIYEWGNKEGVKFRVVVYEKTDGISASHPETIISFYSNRNLKKPMEFRNPEVKYDVNLKEWHKDSSAITKNADGSPKVFYHGSSAKNLRRFDDKFDNYGIGWWFSSDEKVAKRFSDNIVSAYLKSNRLLDFSTPNTMDKRMLELIAEHFKDYDLSKIRKNDNLRMFGELIDKPHKATRFKEFLQASGYDSVRVNHDTIIVFKSNQIKHVKNDGNFSDSPNIYKSDDIGYYDPRKKEIALSDLGDKSTLMHEVQHAIQEIEGFAKGSGAKGENYRLSHGEAEARNVQNRLNLGDKFRAKIVKDNNPVGDDYHAWIRGENDIKTFKQAYDDDGGGDLAPDFTEAMAKKAIDSGEITVYSSKPIKAGSFVTPSKMEAKSYAGSGKIYEEKLNLNDISWIDALQGQVTRNKDIHPHETFDVNPDETIISKDSMINLSKELEKKYILKDGSINEAAVRKEAEPFIEKEYSLENFKAEFPNGKVDTPIGEVAVSNYQFEKLNFKGREKYLGLIKPTLERPAFIVDFEDTTFFFKPFRDKDGIVKFASVIKERDGRLDVTSNYPMANRKFELIAREDKVRYVQGSVAKPVEHSLDNNVRSSGDIKSLEHSSDGKDIIQQNKEKVYHSRKIEEIKQEHPNVEKELDESIAAMRKESFNDVNFKDNLISKINAKDITTKQLGKSVDLSDKQLAVLKNDIKNADFKVISDSKIYFDKMGKDGDKKRFFIDIAEDGKVRVDGYSKKGIDTIPVRQSALEELAGVGDRARLKNMSFEVKAAYFNELDPIKKEAILKTAELNKLKKAAQSGDKVAVAKFEEFRARNLDENGNIKDGLSLC